MERKIGETFEFEGKKLQVKESASSGCDGCFFDEQHIPCSKNVAGYCEFEFRADKKEVIFVEATEQEQAEQPKLNLCEILKDCPKGEMLWSPLLGDVKLSEVNQLINAVFVKATNLTTWRINHDATITIDGVSSKEIMLYPSREQRDWTKVKYEPKKELPRTWKEFCKNYPCKKDEYYMSSGCGLHGIREEAERQVNCDRNVLPSKQAAEAHIALMQLHQLRDAWREGWLPDWKDDKQEKYIILQYKGEYQIRQYKNTSYFLSFQDEKRANEFLTNFRELIELAGDLI